MKKLMKKLKSLSILTKVFIVIDFLVILCFLFVYGPIKYARNFWITTAMETGSHKYLAYVFYSNKAVGEVMSANRLIELTENTDASSIVVGGYEKKTNYESIYEKEILEHNDEDVYKLIKFKYGEFDCYIIAIYDPTRLQVTYTPNYSSPGGYSILTDLTRSAGAIGGINGGGYTWGVNKPFGLIVHEGKVLSAEGGGKYPTAALTNDGVLLVGNMSASEVAGKNVKEALSMGPVLIVNGKSATVTGGSAGGMNPRTAIAQRKDGIILFLVVDGYGPALKWKGRGGVYYSDLITILERYGAYNAINMDGGSSTTMVLNNKLVNNPCEPQYQGQDYIKSAWIFK